MIAWFRLSPLILVLALGACADNPDRHAPLDTLRAEVQRLRPTALPRLAPAGFSEAELALSRAERALGEVPLEEIRHLTAMADLRLRTAMAEGDAAAAREERARLVEERRRMLSEAQRRQLDRDRAEGTAPPVRPAPALPGAPGAGPAEGGFPG